MPISSPCCPKCGLAFDSAGPDHLCGECLLDPPPFYKARAVFQYGAAAKDAVLRLKYGRISWIGEALGRMLCEIAQDTDPPDMLVPVPLHTKRLRSRGFNQSALLAGPSAAFFNRPINTGALCRIRDTCPQAGLTRYERQNNIRGAFVSPNTAQLRKKRILLVDDVITTGMTVREAAHTLLEAGATTVEIVAFARTCC